MERLYSTSQIAMLFKVNRVTIYRWIKKGKVKAYKIGKHHKISVSEVVRLLRKFGFSESSIHDLCGDADEGIGRMVDQIINNKRRDKRK